MNMKTFLTTKSDVKLTRLWKRDEYIQENIIMHIEKILNNENYFEFIENIH